MRFKSMNEIKGHRECMVVLKFLENIEEAVAPSLISSKLRLWLFYLTGVLFHQFFRPLEELRLSVVNKWINLSLVAFSSEMNNRQEEPHIFI